MKDTVKFPNGYDVVLVKKQDILDCIETNITDKEVILALIEKCEIDASNFLKEGRWAGIPYLGNIRIPKRDTILNSDKTKELIVNARNTLDKDSYILFRKNLNSDTERKVRLERYYIRKTNDFIKENRGIYDHLVETRGETIANIICYTISDFVVADDYNIDYDE